MQAMLLDAAATQAPLRAPTSRFRGVRVGQGGKFRMEIKARSKYITQTFEDEEAAARAYDALAREHHGARAKLNFVDGEVRHPARCGSTQHGCCKVPTA